MPKGGNLNLSIQFNPTYADFARYYDLSPVAARVRKPQDKSLESEYELSDSCVRDYCL